MMMSSLSSEIIEAVDQRLYQLISSDPVLSNDSTLGEILLYSMGFDPNGNKLSSGKRLRPLICCLACGSYRGSYQPALDAACAIEMIHNFSLIHDDIEDDGDLRHGRPAVWKKWGLAKGLNAGDALFAKAYQTMHRCGTDVNGLFDDTIMNLTLGQHLDISFEAIPVVSEADYFRMIRGKTVALFTASLLAGASIGGADKKNTDKLKMVGEKFGFAFQIQDDYLGIWGEPDQFGKSVSTDITSRKKTLPIVYAAQDTNNSGVSGWNMTAALKKVEYFADLLSVAGARSYTQQKIETFYAEGKQFWILSNFLEFIMQHYPICLMS